MDKLKFISEMTDSLVWPVVSVVILYVLRKPISNLIPKVKKLTSKI